MCARNRRIERSVDQHVENVYYCRLWNMRPFYVSRSVKSDALTFMDKQTIYTYKSSLLLKVAIFRACIIIVHTLLKKKKKRDNNETVVKMIATHTYNISSYGEYLHNVFVFFSFFFFFHFKLKRIYFYCNLNNALKELKEKHFNHLCWFASSCVCLESISLFQHAHIYISSSSSSLSSSLLPLLLLCEHRSTARSISHNSLSELESSMPFN